MAMTNKRCFVSRRRIPTCFTLQPKHVMPMSLQSLLVPHEPQLSSPEANPIMRAHGSIPYADLMETRRTMATFAIEAKSLLFVVEFQKIEQEIY